MCLPYANLSAVGFTERAGNNGESVLEQLFDKLFKKALAHVENITNADGLDRHLGCGHASFSLNGKRVPTVGNICMDMCMLDVSGVPEAKVGDTVTMFGEDPRVEELAGIPGTIPYEILTSVPRRTERIIV